MSRPEGESRAEGQHSINVPGLTPLLNGLGRLVQGASGILYPGQAELVTDLRQQLADRDRVIEELEAEARTDIVTGIANRRGFEESCEHRSALVRRLGNPPVDALVLIDADNFKEINDTYGHEAGDQSLRHIAASLTRGIRTQDFVARLGGDEFGALILGVTTGQALLAANRILHINDSIREQEAAKSPDDPTRVIIPGLSIGIALTMYENDLATEIARADSAMYAAKQAGRNQVRIKGLLED